MTIESCFTFCNGSNYSYAGLQSGDQCWCGNTLLSNSTTGVSYAITKPYTHILTIVLYFYHLYRLLVKRLAQEMALKLVVAPLQSRFTIYLVLHQPPLFPLLLLRQPLRPPQPRQQLQLLWRNLPNATSFSWFSTKKLKCFFPTVVLRYSPLCLRSWLVHQYFVSFSVSAILTPLFPICFFQPFQSWSSIF